MHFLAAFQFRLLVKHTISILCLGICQYRQQLMLNAKALVMDMYLLINKCSHAHSQHLHWSKKIITFSLYHGLYSISRNTFRNTFALIAYSLFVSARQKVILFIRLPDLFNQHYTHFDCALHWTFLLIVIVARCRIQL